MKKKLTEARVFALKGFTIKTEARQVLRLADRPQPLGRPLQEPAACDDGDRAQALARIHAAQRAPAAAEGAATQRSARVRDRTSSCPCRQEHRCTHNAGGWDGADRRSSTGSPSPLRSPAACLADGTPTSAPTAGSQWAYMELSHIVAGAPFLFCLQLCVGRLARAVCRGRPGSISLRSTEPLRVSAHSGHDPFCNSIPAVKRQRTFISGSGTAAE